MRNLYQQIKPNKISDEIVKQIKALIKKGKLQPGEKLPPERDLAEYFGVGRSSVREAINLLEILGFLERRNRRGVLVRSVSMPRMSDPLKQILEEDRSKVLELIRFRKDIELATAYEAAKFRTEADLSKISKFLENMVKAAQKDDFSLNDEIGFHVAIAQAAHNLIRAHFLGNILELWRDHWEYLAQKFRQKSEDVTLAFQQHSKIFEAIKSGDKELSSRRMKEHLVWIEKRWKEFE